MGEVIDLPERQIRTAVERMIAAGPAAGMRDTDPDHVLMRSMAELSLLFADMIEHQKRAPSDEIERQLRRVAAQSMESAARSVVQGHSRRTWAAILAAGAVALCLSSVAGWWIGYAEAGSHLAGGLDGAYWVAELARNNSGKAMASQCAANQFKPKQGGSACTIRVWTAVPQVPNNE